MRTIHLYPVLALVILLATLSSCRSDAPLTPDPLALAYFDEEHLLWLMSTDKSVKVRFYNVRRSEDDVVGTALAITVDEEGRELYEFLGRPWYQRHDRLDNEKALVDRILETAALRSVEYVRSAGGKNFAANFDHAVIKKMLNVPGCNAIRVTERTTDTGTEVLPTFEIGPVNLAKGVATVVGTTADVVLCTDPCPSFCGKDPSFYLHKR